MSSGILLSYAYGLPFVFDRHTVCLMTAEICSLVPRLSPLRRREPGNEAKEKGRVI